MLSEPKMWVYNGGLFFFGVILSTYATRLTANAATHFSIANIFPVLLYGLWFAAMTNVFAITLNNYFDRDEDKTNPKKIAYGAVATDRDRTAVRIGIAISLLTFIFLELLYPNKYIVAFGIIFFVSNTLYSAPPIRAKRYLIFDTLIGPFYYLSIISSGYAVLSHTWPNWSVLSFSFCYWLAIEIYYNKVIDLENDRLTHPYSTVVLLGKQRSLLLAGLLMCIAGIYFYTLDPLFALVVLPHIGMFAASYHTSSNEKLLYIYSKSYMLNNLLGFITVTFFMFY